MLLLAAALLAAGARADQLEYSGYRISDDSDNEVATTSFSLAKTLWGRTLLLLDIELDQTTIAPLDAITGASRPQRKAAQEFRKSRGQVLAGVDQGLGDDTRAAATYYFSQEVDYRSQSGTLSLTRELFQKNLTLSLRGQYILDHVGEITATNALVERVKETHHATLTVSQILSPTTTLRVGGDGMRNLGFLSNPYRRKAIPRAGSAALDTLAEVHPDERWRQSAWIELAQYLKGLEGSVTLGYRYYWDDWSLEAHTVQITLNKYVSPDWVLSPEYRYYIQTGAYFHETPGKDGFHTEDYKLMPLESHSVGGEVTWFLRGLGRRRPSLDFLTGTSLSLFYFRYFSEGDKGSWSANAVQGRVRFDY